MKCQAVRERLSEYLDGELHPAEAQAVTAHLGVCSGCAERWRSLSAAMSLLAELPPLRSDGRIASRVFDRLEVESRGPGLALLFRSAWKARPLILPSLVPAALVLVSVLAAALALDQNPRPNTVAVRQAGDLRVQRAPSGTEGNPLFQSADVTAPRVTDGGDLPDTAALAEMGERTIFLEIVVARDGSVSTVTLLNGDSLQAAPILDALRHQRFEPGRYRGRPVAVILHRLISHMEVRAAVT